LRTTLAAIGLVAAFLATSTAGKADVPRPSQATAIEQACRVVHTQHWIPDRSSRCQLIDAAGVPASDQVADVFDV
jgi:hypothetical protein